jgi:hypothetical protein
MRTQAHFITRYCATAYYIKSLRYDDYKQRHIRLREEKPGENWEKEFKPVDADSVYKCILQTDADGFILPECCGGNQTIVFLGGSTTQNLVVKPEKRFPFLVAKGLQKKGMIYTVKNAGAAGNNTYNNLNTLINKVMAYRPAAVIYMEAINDLTTLVFEEKYHNKNPFRSLIIDENQIEPEAHDDDEFHAKAGYQKNVDTVMLLKEYKKALKMFVGICLGSDVLPVLMTQPNRIDSNNINTCKSLQFMIKRYQDNFPKTNPIQLYHQMNNAVRQVAHEMQVPLIDIEASVPKTSTYMYDIIANRLATILNVAADVQSSQ